MLEKLKKILENRYASPTYISTLAQETGINRSTLQNKLNGKTQFSIQEMITLSGHLDIPIEELIEEEPDTSIYNMELLLHDFSLHPKNYEYTLEKTIDLFHLAGKSPHSSLYITCNTLPDIIYPEFDWLCRFNLQRWLYFNQGIKKGLTSLPPDNNTIIEQQKYIDAIFSIKRSVYIIHSSIVETFLKNVKYFYDIELLNKDEIVQLLTGLKQLQNRVESIAVHGYVPENGKEVELFYTDIPLSDEMNLIESETINVAVFYIHINHIVINRNPEVIKVMKNWFYSWMRNSKAMSLGGSENLDYFLSKQYSAIKHFEKEMHLI